MSERQNGQGSDYQGNTSSVPQWAVMDGNELKQRKRVDAILQAQHNVQEVGRQASEAYFNGQISSDGRNIRILQAVQEFVREIYVLLMDYSAQMRERGEYNVYWKGIDGNPLGRVEMKSQEDIVFHGLEDLQNAKEIYLDEWTEAVETRHGPDRTKQFQQQRTVPQSVSWNGYNVARMFLDRQKDMEVSFESLNDKRPLSDWTRKNDN